MSKPWFSSWLSPSTRSTRIVSRIVIGGLILGVLLVPFVANARGVHGHVGGTVTWGNNGQTYQRYGGVAIAPNAPIVYPNGVLTVHPVNGGQPVYIQGAHADPRTCYVECFHVPRSQRHPHYQQDNTNVHIWGSVTIQR